MNDPSSDLPADVRSTARSIPEASGPVPWPRKTLGLQLSILLVFLAITGIAVLLRDRLVELERFGYLGAFVASTISSATIVLPVPGLAITFALGSALPSPLLVGLAAGLGETLGELTGYLAGYSGRAIIEDRARYERLSGQMQRYGTVVIFLLAAIPNPTFDLAGIAAGALRFPAGRFLLACWPGKTLKTVLVAYAGAGLLPFLAQWMSQWMSGIAQ